MFWLWDWILCTWRFWLSGSNGFGKNVIIFGAHMNTSVHPDNEKKVILDKSPMQV